MINNEWRRTSVEFACWLEFTSSRILSKNCQKSEISSILNLEDLLLIWTKIRALFFIVNSSFQTHCNYVVSLYYFFVPYLAQSGTKWLIWLLISSYLPVINHIFWYSTVSAEITESHILIIKSRYKIED